MHDAGYNFGPKFQKQIEVESVSGSWQSRSLVDLSEPDSAYDQSHYPMHPACIDGCMQTSAPSLWNGNRSTVNAVLVPAIIDNLVINSKPNHAQKGISHSSSKYVGLGRRDETMNYMSDVSVVDFEKGSLLFEMSGLRYHKLDTQEDIHAIHKYSRLAWEPDISYLSEENIIDLPSAIESCKLFDTEEKILGKVDQIINLIAYKKPNLRVLELNLNAGDSTSAWFGGNHPVRAAYEQIELVLNDAAALMEAQEKYGSHYNVKFTVSDMTKSNPELPPDISGIELAIINSRVGPQHREIPETDSLKSLNRRYPMSCIYRR